MSPLLLCVVKPKVGPPDGYADNFPFDTDDPEVKAAKQELMAQVKGLQQGDVVTIRYTTDFERHRISDLKKRESAGK